MTERLIAPTNVAPANVAPDLAWAAHLISSWWGAPTAPPDVPQDPDAVVKRLRRNGFPLLTLEGRAADAASAQLLASEPFRFALEQDRGKMRRQQAAFAEIVAAWRGAYGIPALFVKAMGPLPSFPYVSNNLDVLVPQARQHDARQVVRELGYVELRHIEEPNKFLFRRFHAGESAFDLHIHGRLEWHTEFVDSQAVWERAAFPADCDLALVPSPEDGLLIALAHAAYENKAYKLIELAKFVYAARVLPTDWDCVFDGAARRGWRRGLAAILVSFDAWEAQLYGTHSLPEPVLRQAQRDMPARLKTTLAERFAGPSDSKQVKAPVHIPFVESKRLFYEKMLTDPSQGPTSRAREIWTHTLYGARVRLRLRSQRPMLIALNGIDGCGKSAQAALLDTALEGAALRHRVVWTRGGSSRLLQPLFAVARRFLVRGRTEKGSAAPTVAAGREAAGREVARSQLFRRPLVRRLWPWAIALELGATWTVRVRWPLLRGEVVVADRYVDSALVELAARLDRPDIARSAPGRLLRWLAPHPAFRYWLDLPVGVALARKDGDESAAFLAKQLEMAPTLRRGEIVDATAPLADLSDRIVTEVLRTYEDRHRTLLNALFCANPRPLERR